MRRAQKRIIIENIQALREAQDSIPGLLRVPQTELEGNSKSAVSTRAGQAGNLKSAAIQTEQAGNRRSVAIQTEQAGNRRSAAAIQAEQAEIPWLLEECQNSAITIGNAIEQSEGEGIPVIHLIEEYCEQLYQLNEKIAGGLNRENGAESSAVFAAGVSTAVHRLDKQLSRIENAVERDIPEQTEVVFLPYKASMWDSLESVWKKADADPSCDAYVIPIPYYDRNPDGSLGTEHYEADQFPSYVPVTRYDEYDFEGRHPDKIYIHNPYDDHNYVTSVHPFFYSKNLKQYTDDLIYIPYFVLRDPDPDNPGDLDGVRNFVTVPGVLNANHVIVQSPEMRQAYINVLVQEMGEQTRSYWEQVISGEGSPKIDKLLHTKKEDLDIPEEWMTFIRKPDGSWKKIVLYNTSVGAFLQHDQKAIDKMRSVFSIFYDAREKVALLWRPHPLLDATIASMRPNLLAEYRQLAADYKERGIGIYDDSADLDRAIVLCDAYYGDPSSVVWLCQKIGKPVMIQNDDVI